MNDQQVQGAGGSPLTDGSVGLWKMMAASFRGRRRWMSVMAWIYMCVWTAVAVVAAVMFFRVETARAMIAWATVFLTAAVFVTALKMWYWMIMQAAVVQDALARLESRCR